MLLLLLFGVWLVLQSLAYVIWTGDTRSIETAFTDATVNYASEPVKGTKYTVEADAPRPPHRPDSTEVTEEDQGRP